MEMISNSAVGTAGNGWISQFTEGRAGIYAEAPYRPRETWKDTLPSNFIARAAAGTSSTEKLHLIAHQEMAAPLVDLPPAVEKARDDRLALLAMKYAGRTESAEHRARLYILTERMRAMVPSVTEADWGRLELVANGMADQSVEIAALEAELAQL